MEAFGKLIEIKEQSVVIEEVGIGQAEILFAKDSPPELIPAVGAEVSLSVRMAGTGTRFVTDIREDEPSEPLPEPEIKVLPAAPDVPKPSAQVVDTRPTPPPTAPTAPLRPSELKEVRIIRQTALKCAAEVVSGNLIVDDSGRRRLADAVPHIIEIAAELEAWVLR